MKRSTRSGLLVGTIAFTSASVLFLLAVNSSEAVQQAKRQAAAAPKQEEERLEPTQVSVAQSRVYTFVGKTGFGHDHGVEGKLKSGNLRLGATEDAGELVFDMTSFDADTDAARRYVGLNGSTDASTRQQVNANMRGDTILAVRRYPTATFAIASAKDLGKKSRDGHPQYELDGKFTLHGTTRPLKLTVTVQKTKEGMDRVRGSFSILQTHYGITPFSKALGAVGVTDKLTIHGDILVAAEAAEAEGAAAEESPAAASR
ncbi:MAG: YceI family protein [Planctomycetaceae bacterium]|nr:YceI family protein [Planctomycetaceae bacterium]